MTTKDTFGYLGNEELDAKEMLRGFAATLEKLLANETGEAAEQVRAQAQVLLAKARPLIDGAAESPERLREVVRRHPFVALGVAGMVGFVLASLRRR
jgi:ElaB/YqjD/DUF883 family membrane-anchored ribosome-binding protein